MAVTATKQLFSQYFSASWHFKCRKRKKTLKLLQSALMKEQYYTTYFDGSLSKQKNALIQRRLQYCTTLRKLKTETNIVSRRL